MRNKLLFLALPLLFGLQASAQHIQAFQDTTLTDEQRVEQLIRLVASDGFGQIVITDCNEQRLRSLLDKAGCSYTLFRVENGGIEP